MRDFLIQCITVSTWRKNVLASTSFFFLVCKLPRDIHKSFEHNPHPNYALPKENVRGFGHVADALQDVARAMKAAM